jgi:hypothetical protein
MTPFGGSLRDVQADQSGLHLAVRVNADIREDCGDGFFGRSSYRRASVSES